MIRLPRARTTRFPFIVSGGGWREMNRTSETIKTQATRWVPVRFCDQGVGRTRHAFFYRATTQKFTAIIEPMNMATVDSSITVHSIVRLVGRCMAVMAEDCRS